MKYKIKCELHAIVGYIIIVLLMFIIGYILTGCIIAAPATIVKAKVIPCSQYRVIVFDYDKFDSLPIEQQRNINIDNMAYHEYCVKK